MGTMVEVETLTALIENLRKMIESEPEWIDRKEGLESGKYTLTVFDSNGNSCKGKCPDEARLSIALFQSRRTLEVSGYGGGW